MFPLIGVKNTQMRNFAPQITHVGFSQNPYQFTVPLVPLICITT